jgi:hypothetical protein
MSTKYKQEAPTITPALAAQLSVAFLASPRRAGFQPIDVNPAAEQIAAHDFSGLNRIEEANAASGFHWFKPDTLRFFRCRLGEYWGAGVFISSETDPAGVRAYSVRVADASGQVHTFGEFHEHKSSRTATAIAKRLAHFLTIGYTMTDGKKFFKLSR